MAAAGSKAENLKGKRITITGGKGFLGKHIIAALEKRGCAHIAIADLPEYDLVKAPDIKKMYRETKPDVVIHLAAKVGGIGFNQENPASLFYENAMMGIQLLHEGYLQKIDKFVALGTICAYPKFTPVPFHEDDLWNGYPEETNAPYGLAKKMMLVQSQSYRKQYGFNSIFLLPVNLYGPGDNFNFASSHVVPALIRKFYLADLLVKGDYQGIFKDFLLFGNPPPELTGTDISSQINIDDAMRAVIHRHLSGLGIRVGDISAPSLKRRSSDVAVEIWGTGTATREFFYVGDAAEAVVMAADRYNKSDPVNIGAGFEIAIKDLVLLITELMGFTGKVLYDTTKPDGQPRRQLDTSRAFKEFGFKAVTGFREGLTKTIEWYREVHRKS